MEYDLIVIGGGPAGYVGAIRAGQLGKRVVCIEREREGGTCLNWGCIPTKALLKSAYLYQEIKRCESFGLKIEGSVGFDFEKIIERSRKITDRMAKGIEYLFRTEKIEHIKGHAEIQNQESVLITKSNGEQETLKGKNILIASGCKSRAISGMEADGKVTMQSKDILKEKRFPESLVIIGAGAIGVEFAYFFNALGSKVTLVEMLSCILPQEDEEISNHLQKQLSKSGIKILTQTKTKKVEVSEGGAKVFFEAENTPPIEAQRVLWAVGVEPNTEGLFAEGVEIETDRRGFIQTNASYETNIKGVFAVGDVIGEPLLAHVASYEATEAVEGVFCKEKIPQKEKLFPACIYAHPEVASLGITEKEAQEKHLQVKISKTTYRANGKAVASGEVDGFVKLIVSEESGEILGAHIIGGEATELIAEIGLAMEMKAKAADIASTVHAHPTLSEVIAGAAVKIERAL